MRSLTYEAAPIDERFQVVVDIYTIDSGGQDDDGNPLAPGVTYYAQDLAADDLQPLSGARQRTPSGDVYEATDRLFVSTTLAYAIPTGATVDVKDAAGGPVIAHYTSVYVADFDTHLQVDVQQDLKGA